MTTSWPVDFSKAGTSSCGAARIAPPAITFNSAAFASLTKPLASSAVMPANRIAVFSIGTPPNPPITRLCPKSDGARRFWVGPSKQRVDQLLCTPYPCGTLLADSEFASALIYDLSFG